MNSLLMKSEYVTFYPSGFKHTSGSMRASQSFRSLARFLLKARSMELVHSSSFH